MVSPVTKIASSWRVVKRSNQLGVRSLSIASDTSAHGYWSPFVARDRSITPEMVADAQVFAAAPQMLEALEATLIAYAGVDGVHPGALHLVRAALIKARGDV